MLTMGGVAHGGWVGSLYSGSIYIPGIYIGSHILCLASRPFWLKAKPGYQLENPTHRPKLVHRDDEYGDPLYPLIPDL